MVIPRSRSRSIESRTCGRWPRSTAPVSSRKRSARVDLPWSMCAMIEKFRVRSMRPMSMASALSADPDGAQSLVAVRVELHADHPAVAEGPELGVVAEVRLQPARAPAGAHALKDDHLVAGVEVALLLELHVFPGAEPLAPEAAYAIVALVHLVHAGRSRREVLPHDPGV